MPSFARTAQHVVVAACLVGSATGASAGVMDFLFGKSSNEADTRQPDTRRKTWSVAEFTELKLVPIEAGAPANTQPVTLSTNALRDLLNPVRFTAGRDSDALFGRDELESLLDAMVDAFRSAGPNEDILLVSSSRHGGGALTAPTAITARLFVQGNSLNLIVRDPRFDYFGEYRGAGKVPVFSYGSRTAASKVELERAGATRRRADWLEIPFAVLAAAPGGVPMAVGVAPAVMAAPAPAATPAAVAPAATAAPAGAAPAAPAAAAAPAAPARARDAAFFEEQEQRLAALKRLRERGLISEEEYQQKRSEVLKAL